jgi:hypothetical protein
VQNETKLLELTRGATYSVIKVALEISALIPRDPSLIELGWRDGVLDAKIFGMVTSPAPHADKIVN